MSKAVYSVPAKQVLNLHSGFQKKLLCDGPTFSAGTACVYSCSFCYVPAIMAKSPHLKVLPEGVKHEDAVIRREGAVDALRRQLVAKGKPKYDDPNDRRVLYMSPLVDVAATVELMHETIAACRVILAMTHWQIRLLSKSSLLPQIANALHQHRDRLIFGVSTGTLDDDLAAAFEQGTAKVSKRLASLHRLQDEGFRTFGMICPSLPQENYDRFAEQMARAIRHEKCEHVWAEVLNARGDSMERTIDALDSGGHPDEALRFINETWDAEKRDRYERRTFESHAAIYPPGKLRFLQYVSAQTRPYWEAQVSRGAVLL